MHVALSPTTTTKWEQISRNLARKKEYLNVYLDSFKFFFDIIVFLIEFKKRRKEMRKKNTYLPFKSNKNKKKP